MRTHGGETPKIHFTYLDNSEIYHIFKTRWIIYGLFSIKWNLFHNFILSVQITLTFFVNALNLNTDPIRQELTYLF